MSTISGCTQQYSFRGDVPISGYTPKKSTTFPKARTWPSRKWRQAPPFKFPRFWLPGPVLWTTLSKEQCQSTGKIKIDQCSKADRKPNFELTITRSKLGNVWTPTWLFVISSIRGEIGYTAIINMTFSFFFLALCTIGECKHGVSLEQLTPFSWMGTRARM